jgi:hypothetical protein
MITPDLDALEADVSGALATGDVRTLRLIGHGEISLVLGWPPDDPVVACKRLPPFADLAVFERYRDVVLRYMEELRARGVRVLDTEVQHLVHDDGRVTGFHVQPFLPSDALAIEILRVTPPSHGHRLLDAIVDTVIQATTDRLGVDAQLSNWVWLDDEAWQLDLTTPFLLDERRRPAFDLAPFLASLPAVVRPVVGREMTKLILRWTTARGSLLDLAANLLKEGMTGWLEPALDVINAHVDTPVTRADAERVHAQDRRLWPVLLRLQRMNRWWQQRVRHRRYEFLLPERTTYEEVHPRSVG